MIERNQEQDLQYRCPDCGGDGKETCHNPDHGFLVGMGGAGLMGANESACPCCGHDPNFKVKGGRECETCGGKGDVSFALWIEYVEDNNLDVDADDYKN
jgi:hypothetical protein